MNTRHHVDLSEAERCELTALVGSGKHCARKIKRARILLAILPLLWLSEARPFTGPSAASLKAISKPP